MKKQQITRYRHRIYFRLARFLAFFLARKYYFKRKKNKLKKCEHYLILSNHQASLDPVYVAQSFTKPIYFVASEHIFNKGFASKLLVHCFSPIKKRKATLDPGCIKDILRVSKEGGNVCIFVEGNRTWTDSQFYISPGIIKLIRKMDVPLMLFNLKGGFGVDPRFSDTPRKGKFTGEINRIISTNELNNMSDEELYKTICTSLDVKDSESNEIYKSNKRAEYLEREFFICPSCKSYDSLESNGNYIKCKNCDLECEYTESLSLKFNKDIKMNKLIEWYNFQIEEIKNNSFDDKEILTSDENIELFDMNVHPLKKLNEGKLILTKEAFIVKDTKILLKNVNSCSIIGGTKLTINTNTDSYIIHGHKRFNCIKYVLYFDKFVENSELKGDKYYGLMAR